MEDPFSALKKSLQPVFKKGIVRNGKYSYPAVQHLEDSLNNYEQNSSKSNFRQLLIAIRDAMPYIENSRVNFDAMRISLDALNMIHFKVYINWSVLLAASKVSHAFQFSMLNHRAEDDLMVWITAKSGKPFVKLENTQLIKTLVSHMGEDGFSQRLNKHLEKEPGFLFDLIKESEENFTKVVQTHLILYLTDQQLAEAIIKHIPVLAFKQKEPYEQVTLLVNKLNGMLSTGRSVSTLLRNAEAKAILDNSVFFQIYQSDEYQNREGLPPRQMESEEREAAKPML